MDKTILHIPMDAELAQRYNESPEVQQKLQFLMRVWLTELSDPDPVARLMAVMDRIGAEAEARGLTDEILDEILRDDG